MSKQIWSVKPREGGKFHTLNYLSLNSMATEVFMQCNYCSLSITIIPVTTQQYSAETTDCTTLL